MICKIKKIITGIAVLSSLMISACPSKASAEGFVVEGKGQFGITSSTDGFSYSMKLGDVNGVLTGISPAPIPPANGKTPFTITPELNNAMGGSLFAGFIANEMFSVGIKGGYLNNSLKDKENSGVLEFDNTYGMLAATATFPACSTIQGYVGAGIGMAHVDVNGTFAGTFNKQALAETIVGSPVPTSPQVTGTIISESIKFSDLSENVLIAEVNGGVSYDISKNAAIKIGAVYTHVKEVKPNKNMKAEYTSSVINTAATVASNTVTVAATTTNATTAFVDPSKIVNTKAMDQHIILIEAGFSFKM